MRIDDTCSIRTLNKMKEFAKFILRVVSNREHTDDEIDAVLREYFKREVSTKKRNEKTDYIDIKTLAKMWGVYPTTVRAFIKPFTLLVRSTSNHEGVSVHYIGFIYHAYELHKLTGQTPHSIAKMPYELIKTNLSIQRS